MSEGKTSRTCSSCGAPGRTSPGPTAATSGGTTRRRREHRARGAGLRRRAPAVHPLHVGHDREAEGHPAHLRRLPHPGRVHAARTSSTSSPRPTSTGAPPTSAGSPGTATSSTARCQRRHPGDVRGHAGHPAQGPLVGDRREVRRDDPLHRADRDPHLHEVGRGDPGRARPVVAAAARARSASRSTPRRGCGTAGSSAATAPRSSTPGGRPRPAPS